MHGQKDELFNPGVQQSSNKIIVAIFMLFHTSMAMNFGSILGADVCLLSYKRRFIAHHCSSQGPASRKVYGVQRIGSLMLQNSLGPLVFLGGKKVKVCARLLLQCVPIVVDCITLNSIYPFVFNLKPNR